MLDTTQQTQVFELTNQLVNQVQSEIEQPSGTYAVALPEGAVLEQFRVAGAKVKFGPKYINTAAIHGLILISFAQNPDVVFIPEFVIHISDTQLIIKTDATYAVYPDRANIDNLDPLKIILDSSTVAYKMLLHEDSHIGSLDNADQLIYDAVEEILTKINLLIDAHNIRNETATAIK